MRAGWRWLIFCGNMLTGIITLILFLLIRYSSRIAIISKADIEISAFLTAFLSFGARPQILKAAERLDSIMDRQPLQYVLSGNWKTDFCGEESFYRTVSKNRMAQLFHWLYTIYDRYESMEDALLCETDGTPMQRLCRLFGVSDKAPQKKLNMFLRWMIRRDSEVDFGIWRNFSPCELIIPLEYTCQ